MSKTLVSFNGVSLNTTDYRSALLSSPMPGANPVFVNQALSDSIYSGTFTVDVRNVSLGIEVIDYPNRYAMKKALFNIFKRGTAGILIVTMEDGHNHQMECVVVSIVQDKDFPQFFTATLQSSASTWKRVTAETDTWTPDTSGDTKAVTVAGSTDTRLIMEITPTTAPASGYAYQRLYQLINKAGYNYGRRPWCITLDTAALVTAGKMQADCDDLRVVLNGIEVPRWIADANTDHTHIWFNVNLAAGWDLTLDTAFDNDDVISEMKFKRTANNLKALKALPAEGILVHGTEWIRYSGKDLASYRLGGVQRGAYGTTQQAHVSGDTFQWLENTVVLMYGNSSVAAPSTNDAAYDDEKPIFALSTSDNSSWGYTTTSGFYDIAKPNRPGSWKPAIFRTGTESGIYLYDEDDGTGDPAIGMKVGSWLKLNRWQNESSNISWNIFSGGGFSEVSMTGQKYRSTARWPSIAALQQSLDGKTWVSVWNEATPVNEDTWSAITQASKATTSSPKWLRFAMYGSIAALADAMCYFEVDTATIVFTAANLPSGSLLSEVANFAMSIILSNVTTGHAVTISCPMLVNKKLLLDSENFVITYDGVNAHSAIALDDESRDVWIGLDPGSNTLKVESESMGTLSIALSWHPRVLV